MASSTAPVLPLAVAALQVKEAHAAEPSRSDSGSTLDTEKHAGDASVSAGQPVIDPVAESKLVRKQVRTSRSAFFTPWLSDGGQPIA